jgi:hypothetical protein
MGIAGENSKMVVMGEKRGHRMRYEAFVLRGVV